MNLRYTLPLTAIDTAIRASQSAATDDIYNRADFADYMSMTVMTDLAPHTSHSGRAFIGVSYADAKAAGL